MEWPAAPVDASAVAAFADAIFRGVPREAFAELRFRRDAGMGRSFHRIDELDDLVAEVVRHACRRDVFVGAIPRRWRRGGRRDLVPEASVVWADCDGADSVAALRSFEPRPSMMVASGSGPNCHAYWLLARPESLDVVERTNRQVADALGADTGSCDAARILRPTGTANWKAIPPTSVRLLALDHAGRVDLADLSRGLPDVDARRSRAGRTARRARQDRPDPLLEIAPRDYVERLTGQMVGIDHKIRCPLHDDRSPSLHVFDEPERGWFCFGCGRGGSIYDFAGLLWDRELRGAEFLRLRQALDATFLSGAGRYGGGVDRRQAHPDGAAKEEKHGRGLA